MACPCTMTYAELVHWNVWLSGGHDMPMLLLMSACVYQMSCT